jgi:signal peptidase I
MATSVGESDVAAAQASTLRQFAFPMRRWSRAGTLISQCFLIAGLAYGAFVLVTHFVIQSVEVVGNSMAPTLENSRRYVLNRWVYLLREPQPADIVVIREPDDQSYAVKRIIGREGDSIHLKDGKLYVNGRPLSEPYLPSGTLTFASPSVKEQLVFCKKNEYFVLGDNRQNSHDSRIFGCVPRQNILGVIIQ